MIRLRVFITLTAAAFMWLAPGAFAQSQEKPKEESLAEAARRARAEEVRAAGDSRLDQRHHFQRCAERHRRCEQRNHRRTFR